MDRRIKTPGPDHPITMEPSDRRVTVRVGDQIVADTTAALVLREAGDPPVYYIPLADVDPVLVKASSTHTYCPYKGEASYYSVITSDGELTDAIWTYPQPYPAVAEIADHVAFYADRVNITAA